MTIIYKKKKCSIWHYDFVTVVIGFLLLENIKAIIYISTSPFKIFYNKSLNQHWDSKSQLYQCMLVDTFCILVFFF